jgi:hypothetical protein
MSLEYWIARRSLSSGAHSRDPLAGDDSCSQSPLGGANGCTIARNGGSE